MGDLTANFSRSEFTCKCGCGTVILLKPLIDALQEVREEIGGPIRINSGTRCVEHNAKEGGLDDSEHLTGEAIDIECGHSEDRWRLLRILPAYFYRIGIGKEFIHVGIKITKPQRVAWLY